MSSKYMDQNLKKLYLTIIIISIIISSIFGGIMGFWGGLTVATNSGLAGWLVKILPPLNQTAGLNQTIDGGKIIKVEEESAVITAVGKVAPAVVSIIVTKDLPKIERYYSAPFGDDFFRQFFGDGFEDFFNFNLPQYRQNGTEKQEIGGGSGFIISADGYIVTNRHVVVDEAAEYTVLLNDESRHQAEVIARDTVNDIAVLKIEGKDYPAVELGDSGALKAGQTVIAIGNALGEFRNTVSVGVISGLARSVIAGGTGIGSEQLVGVIQTDASINPGNSGGPLLNIAGQVIGINTAIVQGAQNIGFAIPINEVRNVIDNVRQHGRIIRPWLGVRYVLVNQAIKEANQLEFDYGAMIVRGEKVTDLAVIPGSPADQSGLKENDIILEINGNKISQDNPLNLAVSKFNPGDEISLKTWRGGQESEVKVKLEEMK